MKHKRKLWLVFGGIIFALGIWTLWFGWTAVYGNNLNADKLPYDLRIPPGSRFEEVYHRLRSDSVLQRPWTFPLVARLMKYSRGEVPSGRFLLDTPMSNYTLIARLRIGEQTPVALTFHNVWTYHQLAGVLAKQLWMDSIQLVRAMEKRIQDPSNHITAHNLLSHFIPNTYYVYWDISPSALLDRLFHETKKFWNHPRRRQKLEELGMTPHEVYTLASIVERETQHDAEKAIIAGVYLNRLKKGMKLQADPTVVYAIGQYDLGRVLFKHLEHPSPYNTYKYHGLPPGPIFMPSISTIDSTLHAREHDYLFFCAKPNREGTHVFARTWSEHLRNARKYQRWLNTQSKNSTQ